MTNDFSAIRFWFRSTFASHSDTQRFGFESLRKIVSGDHFATLTFRLPGFGDGGRRKEGNLEQFRSLSPVKGAMFACPRRNSRTFLTSQAVTSCALVTQSVTERTFYSFTLYFATSFQIKLQWLSMPDLTYPGRNWRSAKKLRNGTLISILGPRHLTGLHWVLASLYFPMGINGKNISDQKIGSKCARSDIRETISSACRYPVTEFDPLLRIHSRNAMPDFHRRGSETK